MIIIFFGKCLFEYKIQFALEKSFGTVFKISWKNFIVAVKKMLVMQFPYMGIV